MGRYMRKGKISGEVAVMEVSHQYPLGVRTRARTLALQSLQKPPPDPPSPTSASYLQLRNRRLEKPVASPPPPPAGDSPRARARATGLSVRSFSKSATASEAEAEAETEGGVQVSFGENVLDVEARDRSVRETTPCSLIRDSETVRTPGSTTRPTNSAATNRRTQNSMRRNIPTTHEMEEFFARAEQLQLRIFAEKYNFDLANGCPLPGRYEWVKLGC